MLGQIFKGDFIILDFYTHQARYAALCINKDKPQMHCNGSCQLSKKIQQEHKTDMDASGVVRSVTFVMFYNGDHLHFRWIPIRMQVKVPIPEREYFLINRDLLSVFRPPETINC